MAIEQFINDKHAIGKQAIAVVGVSIAVYLKLLWYSANATTL